MAALTEQSVFTVLPLARPQLHISPNSPAMAAVARPSASAPASADVTIVLIMVHLLGVTPITGQQKNALPQRHVPTLCGAEPHERPSPRIHTHYLSDFSTF